MATALPTVPDHSALYNSIAKSAPKLAARIQHTQEKLRVLSRSIADQQKKVDEIAETFETARMELLQQEADYQHEYRMLETAVNLVVLIDVE